MSISKSKSVAIIGAGPGGLIAARKLLTKGFDVTIYEKGPRVGGLWDRESLINPDMQANFSIFTVSFSDLAWESVTLERNKVSNDSQMIGNERPEDEASKIANGIKDMGMRTPPIFPKSWMVEAYLNEYANRYIPDSCFQFNTAVVRAERLEPSPGQTKTWKITTTTKQHPKKHSSAFDYLVIASGYLSKPKPLPCALSLGKSHTISILHSTQCRNINQLYPTNLSRPPVKQRVMVIGGSHSGSEISTSLALQASNLRFSPFTSTSSQTTEIEIIHVTPHHMFASPCFPRDFSSPKCIFEPFEYKVYDRATRPPEPLTHVFGLTNPQESEGTKMLMQTVVNGAVDAETLMDELPPYGVVSETYSQFVQDGRIRVSVGQVCKLQKQASGPGEQKPDTVTATILDLHGETIEFDGITAIVNATGFNSAGSLSFLSDAVKEELGFDKDSARLPLILDASHLSQRSSVPDIAVLGFTGANWGVMEMQARAVARNWAASSSQSSPVQPITENAESCKAVAEQFVQFKDAIKNNRRSEIPQVLFGDYIGLMETGAQDLQLSRVNGKYGDYEGMVCPARYIDSDTDKKEAVKTMTLLQDVQRRARDEGLYLARAVFLGLQGQWTSPSGQWSFHPRFPTNEGFEMEYLDIGGGVNRDSRTVFRYDEVHDRISAWTVDPDDGLSAESLAFTLKFHRATEPDRCSAIVVRGASASPHIDLDLAYTFTFKGSWLDGFRMEKETGDGAPYVVEFVRPGDNGAVAVEDVEAGFDVVGEKRLDLPSLKLES